MAVSASPETPTRRSMSARLTARLAKYDSTTGAAINANLITELGGGRSNSLAVEPDSPIACFLRRCPL